MCINVFVCVCVYVAEFVNMWIGVRMDVGVWIRADGSRCMDMFG